MVSLLALTGCVAPVRVELGPPAQVPLVHPSSDRRRWYIAMDAGEHGVWLWFVDTGYDVSNCDDDLVRELGLDTFGQVWLFGEAGRVTAKKARLPPLTIGEHRVSDVVCHVRDLNATSSIRDPREVPVAGVLGMDVWSKFQVHVDAGEAELRLTDPDAAPPVAATDASARLRRTWPGRRFKVRVEAQHARFSPLLDTGSTRSYLPMARAGMVPDRTDEMMLRGTGRSGGTRRIVDAFRVDDLSVGGQSVGSRVVLHRNRPWWQLGPGSILGLDILGDFDQTYDFVTKRLTLRPTVAAPVPAWSPEMDAVVTLQTEER